MSITIKDIANKANTSIATVSRVINGSEKVAEKTRKRILSVMKENNFVKNQFAGSLVSGKSNIISLVAPEADSLFNAYYFKKLFYGITEGAKQRGYSILISQSDGEDRAILKNHFPVDGYLFISPVELETSVLNKLQSAHTPFVLVNSKSENMNWVDVDNVSAIREIVEHLIASGHRNIGLITGANKIRNLIEIIDGYKKAFKENNIAFNPSYIIDGEFTERGAYNQVRKVLSGKLPVTAFVACSDFMAVGAIRAIKDDNLRVPEDIAVIGFDDIDGVCFFRPAITTYRQPLFEMGFEAVNLLIDQIEGERQGLIGKEFIGRLIVRESCGSKMYGNDDDFINASLNDMENTAAAGMLERRCDEIYGL